MTELAVFVNTLTKLAKEHQHKEDAKKRARDAVDIEEVKSRLQAFDLQKFQSSLAELAGRANMSIEWVPDDHRGGWDGNVLIRDMDKHGLDAAVRPTLDIATDVFVGLEPNTKIILMCIQTKKVPTGEHDQLLYYCTKDYAHGVTSAIFGPALVECESSAEKENDEHTNKRLRKV